MFCHKCGNKLPEDSGFCPKCGTKAASRDAVPDIVTPPTEASGQKFQTDASAGDAKPAAGGGCVMSILSPLVATVTVGSILLVGLTHPISIAGIVLALIVGAFNVINSIRSKAKNPRGIIIGIVGVAVVAVIAIVIALSGGGGGGDRGYDRGSGSVQQQAKGGLSYFSGQTSPRGYYLSVRPVTKANGMVSFNLFSGVKKLILETNRFSTKQFSRAVEMAGEYEDELITAVVAEHKAA
jgi:hypothetical protein